MRETTSSLPRLTAAALSRALNLEQGSRLLTVRLPGAVDAEDLAAVGVFGDHPVHKGAEGDGIHFFRHGDSSLL